MKVCLIAFAFLFGLIGWVFGGETSVLTLLSEVALDGKCVQLFLDEPFQRAFAIDYLNHLVYVVDLEENVIVHRISQSAYPVYLVFHADRIYISDFWGHKVDAYDRESLRLVSSIPCKRGPGYMIERGGLLYVASQLEPTLQVFYLPTGEELYAFPLEGRVPKFYLLDDLVILPYYDNFHTWSRDFEMVDSVAFLNPTTFSRWNIEGKIKKPLHILRMEAGKYLVVGYLDNAIWRVDWGQKEVTEFVSWKGHSHIMDVALFAGRIAISSMSEDDLFYVDPTSKELKRSALGGGIIDLEPYRDQYLFAAGNFDNALYVLNAQYGLVETWPLKEYPIAMKTYGNRLVVLNMDHPILAIYEIGR